MSFTDIVADLRKLRDGTDDPDVKRIVRRTLDRLHSYEKLNAEVSVFARSIIRALDLRHTSNHDEA